MKRKYFSALLMGALTIASTSTFTSCKDYDDDIQHLQQQIDANSTAIKQIEDLIKGGSVITSVESASDGVTVKLSDGKSFNIKNGTDGLNGTPGTVWTISEDGYWVKDGVKQSWKAVGEKGEKGEKGEQGEQGPQGPQGPAGDATTSSIEYYVPNAETGYFDVYKNGEKVRQSQFKYVEEVPNSITAALDSKTLTLKGVKGISGETVVISLSGDLKGLVFMPNLYLDGIETLTYDWLNGKYLKAKTGLTGLSRLRAADGTAKKVSGLEDYLPNRLANDPTSDAYDGEFNFGPTWGVKYHMNPSNSEVVYQDVKGFNVLEPTINNFHTRATADDLKVTSPEKDAAGNSIFGTSDGILTAGLSIENPQLLEAFPTIKDQNVANTIAFQAKTKDNMNADAYVTSDYALLQPQKAYVEALYWKKKPTYLGAGVNNTRLGDECGVPTSNEFGTNATDAAAQVHVWDSPQEALADPDGAALELYYNSSEGINIADYLGIHALKENVKNYNFNKTNPSYGTELVKWDVAEAAKWGLKFEFNLVNYKIDGNKTEDSKYAKWVDQSKGILRAWNVDKDGQPEGESATAIDREPLVQVLVKRGDKVVLDGYILIHITRQNPDVAPNKTIDLKAENAEFDLCMDIDKLHSTWSEFSSLVLTKGLENMTKNDFDDQYTIDQIGTFGNDAAGNTTYSLKMFSDAPEKGDGTQDQVGTIEYFPNSSGTTNHTFKWHITAAELEKLTHDKTLPYTITRYVRYVGNAKAKYPYIYVKLSYTLTRKANVPNTFGELIPEYWKSLNGAADGKDAVIFDVKEPTANGDIVAINRLVTDYLKGNTAKITGAHKYYFVPEAVTVAGYTITPQSSATDVVYNALDCKYVANDAHVFNKAKLQETLTNCAIKYNAGAFTNANLYAVKDGVYTKIATLNQNTSEIKLVKNDVTKEILNALGYTPNNGNTNKQLRAWVGVVAKNDCDVAQYVTDGIFLTSWERPINLLDIPTQPVVDANTDGNCIYALDLFKLYDWRGWSSSETEANCEANQSNMWGDHLWFWGYYNVKSITIDTTPANVETTLGGGTWTTMDKISNKVELKCGNVSGKKSDLKKAGKVTYTNDLTSYNKPAKNNALKTFMQNNKAKFGTIWYYNNGGNVEPFSVKVPVTIEYEWGSFTKKVEIKIDPTIGD